MFRVLILTALFVGSYLPLSAATIPSVAPTASVIKGYQEWKGEKIQYAMSQGALLKAQIIKAQAEGNKKQVETLEKQQTQINWNLDVARELSVTDYFVLYLSQQPHPDRFQQAAQKMSTKEVAELIEAYANTLGTSPTEMVVKPAPQALGVGRLPVQAVQAK